MQRHRGIEQRSTHCYQTEVKSAASPAAQSTPHQKAMLLRFVHRYPLVFWSGVWVTLLLMMGIAVTSLMSPEFTKNQAPAVKEEPVPIETIEPPIAPADPNQPTLPVWSLAAIFTSCALGCLLISQRLRQQPQPQPQRKSPAVRKSPKRITKSANAKSALPGKTLAELPASYSPRKPVLPPSQTAQATTQKPQAKQPAVPVSFSAQPIVTVVPTEQSHPLDWEQSSLADDMDIRRRRPLSHWL
jgi:hypothetical protein